MLLRQTHAETIRRLLNRIIVQQQTGNSDDSCGTPAIRFRHPTVADGAGMWDLVRECGVLDVNSCYAYLLICRDFSATSLVATQPDVLTDGGHEELLGFVTAYRPPARPSVLFVWQIGVSPAARNRGIAKSLLRELIGSESCRGIDSIEATIAPSNRASRRLFHSLAEELQGELRVAPGFASADFGSAPHEPEETVRIELINNFERNIDEDV